MIKLNVTRNSILSIVAEHYLEDNKLHVAKIKMLENFRYLPKSLKSNKHCQVVFAFDQINNVIYINSETLGG